jgi:UPF0755 protein
MTIQPIDFDEDDDIVDMPRSRGGLPKVLVVLGMIVVAFLALGVGVRSWVQRQYDPPGPPGEEVSVVVPTGATLTDLGSLLDDPNVVANGTLFRFWIRDQDIELQAGRYVFQRNSSFDEVADVLRAGPVEAATQSLTIPEGYRIDQIVDAIVEGVPRFEADAVRAAIDDPANRSRFLPAQQTLPPGVPPMEGMLFPSTYEVGPNDTEATLVARMVQEMDARASGAGIDAGLVGDNLPPLDPYQVLIVASMIERETGNPEESAKIARVIYNRMLDGPSYDIFGLGIDATSQYYADVSGTEPDFETPGPYNTRASLALPPTPIAAPGLASIQAALNPAPNPVDGPLLYYVLETPTSHVFTSSYEDFLVARDACVAAELC